MARCFIAYSASYVHMMELVRQIAISMDFDVEVFDGPDPTESLGKAVISRIQKSDCLIAILGPEGKSEELENHNEAAQWPTQEAILALGRNMPLIVIQHPDIKLPALIESNQVPIRINFWDIKEREAKIQQVVEELYKLRQEIEKKSFTKNRQKSLFIPIITGLLILIFAINSILTYNSISLRKKENALALMDFWSQNLDTEVRSRYKSFKNWIDTFSPRKKEESKKWLVHIAQGIKQENINGEIPVDVKIMLGLKEDECATPDHFERYRLALVRLLNTLEGIAISYQSGAADKDIISELFKESVTIYTSSLKEFINTYRKQQAHSNAWQPLYDLVFNGAWKEPYSKKQD